MAAIHVATAPSRRKISLSGSWLTLHLEEHFVVVMRASELWRAAVPQLTH
jgi:hypothetical protein